MNTIWNDTAKALYIQLLAFSPVRFRQPEITPRSCWSPSAPLRPPPQPLVCSEQVILFRLRTGHNRLNAHMYNKFKVGESDMCPCNADIMAAEHLLHHCRLHDALRRDMWPEPTLRDKLYGNLEELRRTAAFVRATGISVQRMMKKKKTLNSNLFASVLRIRNQLMTAQS